MTDSIFGLVELTCRDMWVCSQVHRNTNHFVNTLRIFSCQMLFSVGRIHRTGVWCNVCLAIKVVKMFEFRYVYIFSVQEWQNKKCTEKLYFAEYFQVTTEWQLKSHVSFLVSPITRADKIWQMQEWMQLYLLSLSSWKRLYWCPLNHRSNA